MEPQSLETASSYLNNLLLSRGLLRNGKPVDFACPKKSAGGADATMAKIINLVHDLVLRRDQDSDQREKLASTIRNLRATETRQTLEIERLQAKSTDLSRSLSLAEGQERAHKTTLRSAEASARTLREQMQRMKATLDQVRAQCANDVRKRDAQLQKLKTHLTGVQRGKRDAFAISTITITPTSGSSNPSRLDEREQDINRPGYSLNQETTEFLTKLCQNLSDENDSLIALARYTIATLRNVQGLPNPGTISASVQSSADPEPSGTDADMGNSLVDAPPMSCEALSAEMEVMLGHLRSLLTNPSYVPIEELELREDEIVHLREGWEKMEARWRDAMTMMDTWRKRIADGGDSVNLDELRTGISLGKSIAAYRHAEKEPGADAGSSSAMFDDDEDGDGEKEAGIEGPKEVDVAQEQQYNSEEIETSSTKYLRMSPRKPTALGVASENIRLRPTVSPRKVSFETQEENIQESNNRASDTDEEASDATNKRKRDLNKIRVSRQMKQDDSPPMTISQKLAAVEAEACIAADARRREEVTHKRKPVKDSGRTKSRRRSTLCPEELENLMGVH